MSVAAERCQWQLDHSSQWSSLLRCAAEELGSEGARDPCIVPHTWPMTKEHYCASSTTLRVWRVHGAYFRDTDARGLYTRLGQGSVSIWTTAQAGTTNICVKLLAKLRPRPQWVHRPHTEWLVIQLLGFVYGKVWWLLAWIAISSSKFPSMIEHTKLTWVSCHALTISQMTFMNLLGQTMQNEKITNVSC